jgi:hypothetical protein
MEYIPTAISVAALIVSFVALRTRRRSSDIPQEKRTYRKRQPKEQPIQA